LAALAARVEGTESAFAVLEEAYEKGGAQERVLDEIERLARATENPGKWLEALERRIALREEGGDGDAHVEGIVALPRRQARSLPRISPRSPRLGWMRRRSRGLPATRGGWLRRSSRPARCTSETEIPRRPSPLIVRPSPRCRGCLRRSTRSIRSSGARACTPN